MKKINIKSPNEVFEKFLKWFDSNKKIAFFTVLIIGIITHITFITEMIMSQDGLWNSIEYSRPGEWEISLGRWGIVLIDRLNFFIAIPTVTTILCLGVIAISNIFLIDLLNVKNKIHIFIISVALAVMPSLTATLTYIYTALAYCTNFLITILSVWFLVKYKNKKIGYLFSSILTMFCFSIYQSYIGVITGIIVFLTIIQLLENKENIKNIILLFIKRSACVVAGGILYFIITKIILKIKNITLLSGYKNMSINIGEIFNNIFSGVIQAYRDFFEYYFGDKIIFNSNYLREYAYLIFIIILILSCIIKIIINIKNNKKTIVGNILCLILILILPIALNVINLLVVDNELYSLTSMQLILIIPFGFAILENNNLNLLKWIAVLFGIYIVYTYYVADNTSYIALKLTYNQAYSTMARVIDRIETTEGYEKDMPVLFGSIIGNDNYPRTSSLYGYTIGSMVNNPVFHVTYYGANGTIQKFIKIYFGIEFNLCSAEDFRTIVTSDEYKEMETFPNEDSVKIIDGIMVVKLREEPELPF